MTHNYKCNHCDEVADHPVIHHIEGFYVGRPDLIILGLRCVACKSLIAVGVNADDWIQRTLGQKPRDQ